MKRLSAAFHIAGGLACLSMAVLFAAQLMGLVPDRRRISGEGRVALSEAIAINCSLLVGREDIVALEASLRSITERNADLISVGIRRHDGRLFVAAGNHPPIWQDDSDMSTDGRVRVPITITGKPWGQAELQFKPLVAAGLLGYVQQPVVSLSLFAVAANFIVYWMYLRRVLQHLDPSKAIPDRVRSALDTLAEGLVVLDKDERIVMANKSFSETVGRSSSELVGSRASELPWTSDSWPRRSETLPWTRTNQEGTTRTGDMLRLNSEDSERRTFKVNSAPILGEDGTHRGVLASFDEVTLLQKQMEELSELRDDLIDTAREAGMAEIATNVLHNVGNVLNSVNVSAAALSGNLKASRVSYLSDISELLAQHSDDLGTFFTQDEKGKRLPLFISHLAEQTKAEKEANLTEIRSLVENVDHIKAIVTMQQSYIGVSDMVEPCSPSRLMNDALRFANIDGEARDITVVREYDELPEIGVVRGKLLQILVNLIKNAKDAVSDRRINDRVITLRTAVGGDERVLLEVADNGTGIAEDVQTRIFSHGFTTKKHGHGFGLHSAALAAEEMGGALRVHSPGLGKGATFTLELPMTESASVEDHPVDLLKR